MPIRIAINGFGRIGRTVLRQMFEQRSTYQEIELVAINDLITPPHLAYLLKYDSIHGPFQSKVKVNEQDRGLLVGEESICLTAEQDPEKLPWKELNIDYVIEATGRFTHKEAAERHLKGGAKRVVISAPAKGGVPTYVFGVNHTQIKQEERVVSNASCTTNCLAPVAKVLLEEFGIEEGLMTTIHAVTAGQSLQDGISSKDYRGGRSAMLNLIPSSTGAAQAVALCLPQLKDKLTGMAVRVPVIDVSLVDLTVRLQKSVDYDRLCSVMEEWAEGELKGVLGVTKEAVVSSDFIGDRRSSIFDTTAGIALNDRFFKLCLWYDNEVGYACRLLDLIRYMGRQF